MNSSDIAVVGIACRFPGSRNASEYWRSLIHGNDAVKTTPLDRRANDGADISGKPNGSFGGYIDSYDSYDISFFDISKSEAKSMDPQQLLALQVAWHAVEDARFKPSELAGESVGVFVGATSNDFESLSMKDRSNISGFTPTGINGCIISSRISYALDLRGPCMTINTACSSSLVAIHEACMSLRTSQCNAAIAGGVNLLLSPDTTMALSQAGMLSPEGRCKTFDAAANGYVRSEGCGMLVLKRKEDAIADGDRIYGLINGSAVNQDGLTNGLTAPNRYSQEDVIKRALVASGKTAKDIGYIEAHGTGTKLGDPIEVNAIKSVYASSDDSEQACCYLGSVKAQIGHLEPAAGVAGLIKILLQIDNQKIVYQIGVEKLNPLIKLEGTRLKIAEQGVDWKFPIPQSCAISSFGYGGTNCHMIVSPSPPNSSEGSVDEDCDMSGEHILPISAQSLEALTSLKELHFDALKQNGSDHLKWFAAASNRVEEYKYREAFVGKNRSALIAAIEKSKSTEKTKMESANRRPNVVFLFPGQGSQVIGMGKSLYNRFPQFAEKIDSCNERFFKELGISLKDLMWEGSQDLLSQTDHTQPALYVLQVAIAQLWQSLGVKPSNLLGHSIGEYAAAHVSGVFDFDQGLDMVFARGRLMQEHAANGHMVAVRASQEDIQNVVSEFKHRVCIAACNSPRDSVLAVKSPDINLLIEYLETKQIHHIQLKGSRAFHTPWMSHAADKFVEAISDLFFDTPKINILDNLGGGRDTVVEFDKEYWRNQMTSPVLFADCAANDKIIEADVLIEIGVGTTLITMAALCSDARFRKLPSLLKGETDCSAFLKSVAAVYQAGSSMDWSIIYPSRPSVDLPKYPFVEEKIFELSDFYSQQCTSPSLSTEMVGQRPGSIDALKVIPEPIKLQADADYQDTDNKTIVVLPSESHLGQGIVTTNPAKQCFFIEDSGFGFVLKQISAMLTSEPNCALHVVISSDCHRRDTNLEFEGEVEFTMVFIGLIRELACFSNVESISIVIVPDVNQVESVSALLLGASKSIAFAYPNVALKMARIKGEMNLETLECLYNLAQLKTSGEYVIRENHIFELVLEKETSAFSNLKSKSSIVANETYIISGGTGTLGLQVARGLIRWGAKEIVLLSRSGDANFDAHAAIPEMAHHAIDLQVVSADVTSRADLEKVFHDIKTGGRKLGGIFHAAGNLVARESRGFDYDAMLTDASSKVVGINLLSELSQPFDPSFIVAFSSISALWGGVDLATYSASNRYLDEWAQGEDKNDSKRISINWGPWKGSKMVTLEYEEQLAASGVNLLDPHAAIETLFELLKSDISGSIALCSADWSGISNIYKPFKLDGFFKKLVTPSAAGVQERTRPSMKPDVLDSGGEWREKLVEVLLDLMGIDHAQFDPADSLREMGLNSLMVIEFNRAVALHTGLDVSPTFIFDHPTYNEIVSYLEEKLGSETQEMSSLNAAEECVNPEEEIAVIGLACNLPGHCSTPEEFWATLMSKVNPVVESRERWASDLFSIHKSQLKEDHHAFFIDDIEKFDARLFGISPVEAKSMDPQQRMALEMAWRCFEYAGYRPKDVKGQKVGTFIGVSASEYLDLVKSSDLSKEYQASGNALNVIPGRVAYYFGMTGPAIAIDTACSSSLVALHQAISSLRSGECEMALAGGVNTLLSKDTFTSLSDAKMLSKNGRCATFDSSADGYVRSEGGALFLLKPVSLATRDGDKILAVLKSSAINQDGKSASLTAPHGASQVDVMRQALHSAQLRANNIDWVEAHGTGTPLGDPIELQSIDKVYGDPDSDLIIGAVKSNIGHLESASGAVGLLKIILSLRYEKIPPNIHFEKLNPFVGELKCRSLVVPVDSLPWPAQTESGKPIKRRAAVSSYGFSGTNAHMIVESGVEERVLEVDDRGQENYVLPISAHTKEGFSHLCDMYRLIQNPSLLIRACRYAQWMDNSFRWRRTLVAENFDELTTLLEGEVEAIDTRKSLYGNWVILDSTNMTLAEERHWEPAGYKVIFARCQELLSELELNQEEAGKAKIRSVIYSWARLLSDIGLNVWFAKDAESTWLAKALYKETNLVDYLLNSPLASTESAETNRPESGYVFSIGEKNRHYAESEYDILSLVDHAFSERMWFETLAQMTASGYSIDWRIVSTATELPSTNTIRYPMEKIRYWAEPSKVHDHLVSVDKYSAPESEDRRSIQEELMAQINAMHSQISILENI